MFRRLLASSVMFCAFWALVNNESASAQYVLDVACSTGTQQVGGGQTIPVISGSATLSNLPPSVQSATANFEFFTRLKAPGQNPNPNPWNPWVTDYNISSSPTQAKPNEASLQTGTHSYNPSAYEYKVKVSGSFVQPGNPPGTQLTWFTKESPIVP